MKKTLNQAAPLWRTRKLWIPLLSALLAAGLLLAVLIPVLSASDPVYGFGGATLREDAYRYWFASYKYVYQVRYKDLDIADTEAGWATPGEDGRSYGEVFFEDIDEEIRLRFIAASLFDSAGCRMSDAYYEELNTLIEELGTDNYGERGFSVLKDAYGVRKSTVKQVALYEQKYRALYDEMFADASAVYDIAYREELTAFYEKYYLRYNMIYVSADKEQMLLAALRDGVSEQEFTELEAKYNESESKVTSGNYPNGIYLYAGGDYTKTFSSELLSAFAEANEVGKWVKKSSADGEGVYFVMRYALDKEPYLSEDEKIRNCFKDLPSHAASYLYRAYLIEQLDEVFSHGVAERYTVAGTVACRDYNVVRLLGNG